MIRQPVIGRPLTKKLMTQLLPTHTSDEDEGYVASPKTASPHTNGSMFTFAPTFGSQNLAGNARAFEDEWSSLEQELNRVLQLEPQPPVCDKNFKTPPINLSPYKSRPKNKDFIANKTSRSISCQFCAKNGEIRSVVESHMLRHPVTRVIICPVLRRYVCDLCGATGDNAHTKFYCPENHARKAAPMAVLLKTTRNNATGKRARHQ